MKKFFVFAIVLFVLNTLGSAAFKSAPYNGFSGIPIGSKYYKGGKNWSRDYNEPGGGPGLGQDGVDTYANKEMIALIGLYGIENTYYNDKTPFTLSISCPNGMYMTSMSNPEFKRPFKLYFYPVVKWETDKKGTTGTHFELSNDSPVINYYPSQDAKLPVSKSSEKWSIWFDVVLYLPGEVNTSNDRLIDDDGTIYPLIKASDYSAIVTLSILFEGADAPMDMVIPFTGYYDGSEKPVNNAQLPVSLGVETYPAAYNINLSAENRGQWISVGKVNLLLNGSKNLAMFLSSSPSADIAGEKFVMVKDDLGYDTQLTSVNSINFEVQMVDSSGVTKLFDGTDKVDLAGSITSLPSNFISLVGKSTSVYFNSQQTTMTYSQYEGEMQVKLERSDVTLLEGRYEGEIYIHVLVEE